MHPARPKRQQAAALESLLAELRADEKQMVKDVTRDCLDDVLLDQRTFHCVMQAKTQAGMDRCFEE
ncbi:MAG: hypothetical protein AMXMBFR34_20280 [Myxococcaceae bacterium]